MKPFALFFGASGQLGTSDVTSDPHYKLVVDTVNQLRDRLLKDEGLRQPFLHLFSSVYVDNSDFPDDLKPTTPIADQIPNMSKIKQIRHHPPTDGDVVDFLTNSFPNIYLFFGDFGPGCVSWGETWSGRGEASEEKVMINMRLVQLWLEAVSALDIQCSSLLRINLQVSTPVAVSPTKLLFMFIAILMHELGHNCLVWYGRGACDSLQLGGIEIEAGEYIEKIFFGGISYGEFEIVPRMRLLGIGLRKGEIFYPIGECQFSISIFYASHYVLKLKIDDKLVTELIKFDTSKGLPFLDTSTLSPAPPATFGRLRSKFSHTMSSLMRPIAPEPRNLSETRMRPLLKNDKIRIMPRP